MDKHKCKVKFHNRKIVCASQILCTDCPEQDGCQDIDIYIESRFEGVRECMTKDSYAREKGKLRQKTWEK